jgi:hypothetical protein
MVIKNGVLASKNVKVLAENILWGEGEDMKLAHCALTGEHA